METHSSILAWRTPWTEEPGRLTVHGVTRVGHSLVTEPPYVQQQGWISQSLEQYWKNRSCVLHYLYNVYNKKVKYEVLEIRVCVSLGE